ncbi:D-alanyl-lipoteichoic acid acyltransferase DltB, MBOAT superfamily [Cyclobacterium lianum]|uniref:D-alanyl-lipoteichoic acid acyltransferase DltB, MBOAT superfamily n=1 Tax=Cyclobacterium lianum TaxID=388280 RepID=A0A1M7HZ07_9BACT|nr:MBOAT family O-acyltransferase [Cyclobacterium lianum]SHM33781.1 D-alanyl-lipoteichoic acid acyltransferase DltB, MBOAT superfamily [Cyclobacterium lianum]
MLFNSIEFLLFLPLVFILYWFVFNKDIRLQNLWILVASYIFYGWWDYRFLTLIAFSSLVDFLIGLQLNQRENPLHRKWLLFTSLVVNIGFLGFFKYYNFFADSFADAFTLFGRPMDPERLAIVLPVGISFYTFQTMSYTIDVYRKKLAPSTDPVSFFAYVSFFPQLVAGPIERATHLLPQFLKTRVFQLGKAHDGMRQILWGLFKKIVIADNCAIYVNDIFSNYEDYSGSTLFLGAVLFALQIYGDFSGYSDIAIGTARLFGFDLRKNFAFPYFSRDIAEFWRRWHISLSTWFRDYLYIPLGGSQNGKSKTIRNIFIIFMVSGFWHGANWTFIFWGALHAAFYLPLLLTKRNRQYTSDTVASGKIFPSVRELLQMSSTFLLTSLAWIFFRADSMGVALDYLSIIFSARLLELPVSDFWTMNTGNHLIYLFFLIIGFLCVEWSQREKNHGLELDEEKVPRVIRWGTYYTVMICCFIMNGVQQEFIYFQF